MEQQQKEKVLKLLVIGDENVGKTQLILTQTNTKQFSQQYKPTIGVDFTKVYYDDDVSLQIWDTSGQERYTNIVQAYYERSDILIMVYDITNMISFQKLNSQKEQFFKINNIISEKEKNNFTVIIVANKGDLYEQRQVPFRFDDFFQEKRSYQQQMSKFLNTIQTRSQLKSTFRKEILREMTQFCFDMENYQMPQQSKTIEMSCKFGLQGTDIFEMAKNQFLQNQKQHQEIIPKIPKIKEQEKSLWSQCKQF